MLSFYKHLWLKGRQAWNFSKYFFCRNRILMVSRACNTRFLKIVFDSAEIFDFYTFPRMVSRRWNCFLVCSPSYEIRSAYAQPAMKFVPCMLSIFSMTILKWVLYPLSQESDLYLPSSVPCLTWPVPCLPYSKSKLFHACVPSNRYLSSRNSHSTCAYSDCEYVDYGSVGATGSILTGSLDKSNLDCAWERWSWVADHPCRSWNQAIWRENRQCKCN
jgi:hypothetical protein